jgi:DNA-binding response OmpR family regulator
VLRFFTENAIRVLRRVLLLNGVWGYNAYPTTRTVDDQILKLRQKLELDPANPKHILTIYGAGTSLYRDLKPRPSGESQSLLPVTADPRKRGIRTFV